MQALTIAIEKYGVDVELAKLRPEAPQLFASARRSLDHLRKIQQSVRPDVAQEMMAVVIAFTELEDALTRSCGSTLSSEDATSLVEVAANHEIALNALACALRPQR